MSNTDKQAGLRSGTYFKRLSNRQIKRIYSRLPPCQNKYAGRGCELKNICLLCDRSIRAFSDLTTAHTNKQIEAVLDNIINSADSEGRVWVETLQAERQKLKEVESDTE